MGHIGSEILTGCDTCGVGRMRSWTQLLDKLYVYSREHTLIISRLKMS